MVNLIPAFKDVPLEMIHTTSAHIWLAQTSHKAMWKCEILSCTQKEEVISANSSKDVLVPKAGISHENQEKGKAFKRCSVLWAGTISSQYTSVLCCPCSYPWRDPGLLNLLSAAELYVIIIGMQALFLFSPQIILSAWVCIKLKKP